MITNNFKNSEIGYIPNDWDVKALGEIAEILNGDRSERYPKDNEICDQGVPFINAGHITNGKVDFSNMDYISTQKYNSMSGVKLQKDDILICLRGSLGKNAKINFSNGTVASSLCVIRTNKADVDYLLFVFNSYYLTNFIKEENNGSSQPNLSATNLLSFLLPLPPLPEQRRIAAALSDIDALIDNLDALIDKKRLIKQATMQQLLSGKKRINGFNDKWVEKKFEDIFETISSRGKHIETTEYLDNGKYPIVDQGQKQIIGFTNLNNPIKCPKNGSIVFGDHTRIFKFVDFDFYVGADGTQVLNVKDSYYCRFVYYVCLMLDIPNTGYNRHFKFLKEAIFSLPPTLAEQSAISKILSDMDEEISLLEAKKEKYTHLKQGMMSELLSGRIRI
ncbi:MAG: restriction endonuclease subunit S [Bacteroidales bacterium]|nr:restriction endonuclease subunit S [Bacteroidales bacterium]